MFLVVFIQLIDSILDCNYNVIMFEIELINLHEHVQ